MLTTTTSENENYFFYYLFTAKVSNSYAIDANIEEYLQVPLLPHEEYPLVFFCCYFFWKANEMKCPSLARLVSVYLCIPAFSAPVERLLSIHRNCVSTQ